MAQAKESFVTIQLPGNLHTFASSLSLVAIICFGWKFRICYFLGKNSFVNGPKFAAETIFGIKITLAHSRVSPLKYCVPILQQYLSTVFCSSILQQYILQLHRLRSALHQTDSRGWKCPTKIQKYYLPHFFWRRNASLRQQICFKRKNS